MCKAAMRYLAAVLTTVLAAKGAVGATPPPDPIPQAQARQVVARIVELVESRALPPRQQDAYLQAKQAVLAGVEGDSEVVDRRALYARVKTMLDTLDADGHSMIMTPVVRQNRNMRRMAGTETPRFAVLATSGGKVLHWTPPQTVNAGPETFTAYLKGFLADAAAVPDLQETCALVVDLSAQRGGNGWPPLVAMHPLLGDANGAAFVDRDGQRTRYAQPANLRRMQQQYIGASDNPLSHFAGLPYAVVVDKSTVSAGEMLLVALLGEGARGQSFGRPSYGLTTGNGTYRLPDGSTLLLSQTRYAIGDGPLIRGAIAPQHAALPEEAREAVVQRAAQWAASQSPRCRATQAATVAMK